MDPELCRRAKEGDADAFASLYETVSSKLYSTAFYMLGRKEDAEDVVMETVTDAFSEIRSLREPAAFEGWIFRILMNKINELGEPDSTIILQKYYFDRSSGEIAELLSMKASAVRMRAARALEKLKKSLAAAGITL